MGEALSFPVFDYDSWPGREIINVLGYPISQKLDLLLQRQKDRVEGLTSTLFNLRYIRIGIAPAAPPFSWLPLPLASADFRLGRAQILPECACGRATP